MLEWNPEMLQSSHSKSELPTAGQYLIHTVEKNHAEFRIRIWIGTGFNQVSGSVFRSGFGKQIRIQENKNDPQNIKN
jgi:hypothetical protein